MKKTWELLIKESFTKPLHERYAEMSKGERFGYWTFFFIVILLMLIIWFH
jgi:hypothetical protein